MRYPRIALALDAVLAGAGLAICGLALTSGLVEDGRLSLPFPVSSGAWTAHAFQARFRHDALARPQVKRFRDWLLAESAATANWLRFQT
jgi:LysR family glycine cleavage system transcriptional activator